MWNVRVLCLFPEVFLYLSVFILRRRFINFFFFPDGKEDFDQTRFLEDRILNWWKCAVLHSVLGLCWWKAWPTNPCIFHSICNFSNLYSEVYSFRSQRNADFLPPERHCLFPLLPVRARSACVSPRSVLEPWHIHGWRHSSVFPFGTAVPMVILVDFPFCSVLDFAVTQQPFCFPQRVGRQGGRAGRERRMRFCIASGSVVLTGSGREWLRGAALR